MYRVKLSWWPLPNVPKVFTCGEAKARWSDAGGQAGQGCHPPQRHPSQATSPPFPSAVPFTRQATDTGQEENFWLLFSSVPKREGKKKKTNQTKTNKRDFFNAFLTSQVPWKAARPARRSASPLGAPSAGRRASGAPSPPPQHPEREQVRAPEWEGHPPRSLPVPGTAARSGGRPGRAHPGHQRALQEQLHELRHSHVHAEPRPRRTKRLRQPAAGAGDKGGARAHGARLQPRPPGESERMGAGG